MKKPKLCKRNATTVLSERVYRAGYVVRRERIEMKDCPMVEMESAYTPDGHYIGNPKDARYLIVKRGIRPQLRTPASRVCSIGYNADERKWYGWSHRAIAGFAIGSVVKKGDVLAHNHRVGSRAKTLSDARGMAYEFAEAVS
jgi:hypothetical protein